MKLKLKDIVILIILFTICTAIIFYGFIFKKDSVQLNTNYYEGIYDSSFTVVEGGSSGSSKNHELLFFKNMSNNAWNSGTVYVTPGTTIYFDQGTAYVAKWTVSSGSESFSINESSWYEGNGTVGSNAPLGSTFVIKCTRTGATDREIDFEVVWEENIAYNVNNSNSSNSYKSEMKPTRSKTVTWTLPTTDPTATGYNFLGWYDGSTYVGKAGNTYSKTYTEHNQTTTLTASWEAIKYKVEFDSNGGTGTMELQDFTYNQSQALTPNSFTRPGYEFKGWATSASSSKVEYGDNQNISNLSATDGDKKTLYAVWEKIPEYNITYDLDGGTSTNKSTWKKSDGEIELKDASKSGYEFLGWYTDKTFTNKITVLNSSTVTRDITIYARFEMKYTIEHYYQNLDNNQYTKDSSKTDTATAKLGTQISSYSDKAGTGFEFKEVKPTILTIAENSDNTMKVYYDRILMEISFENTGDSTIPSQTIKYGGTLEEPSIKPSRKGYEFTGWYLDADGDNKADSTEAYNFSTQVTSQISIVAGWSEIKKYTLIYNLDGGINSVDNKVEYSKDDLSFSLNPASKTGYIFKGWYADSNFENSITSENISEQALNFADKDYNLNLYAKFEINKYPYKIEYYYQNIKDDNYTIDTSKTYEGTAEFETKITTYEDKAGIGFKLKEVKPTILTITEKSDNIMKVYYDRDLIEVSFSDPGSTAIDSQTTKYSGIIEEPDNPKRDGYKFLGWYIDNDGDGTPDSDTEYDFDTPVTGKVNLVAKWKVINYKITYDLNGGTNSDDNPEKITIEDKIILSFPTRTGYDFDGWYDKEEKRVTDLTGVSSDIKLTAKWTPKQNTPYTIIHNYENLDGSYKEESIEKSTDTTDKQLDITGI